MNAFGKPIKREMVDDYSEIPGYGVKARVKGREVLVGNVKLLREYKVDCSEIDSAGTVVYAALDGRFAGYFIIADEPREDSADAVKGLKSAGVKERWS